MVVDLLGLSSDVGVVVSGAVHEIAPITISTAASLLSFLTAARSVKEADARRGAVDASAIDPGSAPLGSLLDSDSNAVHSRTWQPLTHRGAPALECRLLSDQHELASDGLTPVIKVGRPRRCSTVACREMAGCPDSCPGRALDHRAA